MTLENERRALEEQRRTLERERREFTRRVEIEFKILEEELVKLATEKEQVQKQKAFYQRVHDFEFFSSGATRKNVPKNNVVKGEMFFSGVESKQSLKKRYKDLIKIYHPDNLDGDTDTIQEINSEYNKLCAVYKV